MTEADQPQATDASTTQAEYDSPWKEALEVYFEPFLALLFPAVHELIDWSRPYESLEQEFQQLAKEVEVGKRFTDKLFKVCRQDGEAAWVLVHIEVVRRESRALSAIALLGLRLRSLLGLLAPSSHVTESLTLPTSAVSNEPDGMQGTKARLQQA